MKLEPNEKWVEGLSDCCNAPLKEVGKYLSILVCGECEYMCNRKNKGDDDDDFPDDFFEDDED